MWSPRLSNDLPTSSQNSVLVVLLNYSLKLDETMYFYVVSCREMSSMLELHAKKYKTDVYKLAIIMR